MEVLNHFENIDERYVSYCFFYFTYIPSHKHNITINMKFNILIIISFLYKIIYSSFIEYINLYLYFVI